MYINVKTAELVAPTIEVTETAGTNDWYTEDEVNVTITNTNGEGTLHYLLIGATTLEETTTANTSVSLKITATGLTKIRAWVENDSGESSENSYKNIKIDNSSPTAPTIKITSPTAVDGENNWYVSNVIVELSSSDNSSGIYGYIYTIINETTGVTVAENETAIGETKEITFATDGEYTIKAKAIDRAGNMSSETTETKLVAKDSTKPAEFIPEIKETTSDTITIVANTTDETSGINRYEYYVKSEKETEYILQYSGDQTEYIFTAEASTSYGVYVIAYDNAGNVRQSTIISEITEDVDTTSLVITVSPESDTSWGTSTEVTITVTDSESKLSSDNTYEYFISTEEEPSSEGTLNTYDETGTTIMIDGTGKYYLFVKQISDEKENTSTSANMVTIGSTVYHRYGIYYEDNTAPTANVESYTTESVTFTAKDNDSGISYYQVTESTSEPSSYWIIVENTTSLTSTTVSGLTQDTTYHVWVKDQAGNTGYDTFTTGTVPSGNDIPTTDSGGNVISGAITFSKVTWSRGIATTTISSSETGYYIEYQINGTTGTWIRATIKGANITATGLYDSDTIYARLSDGTNEGDYASLTILDTIAPIITVSPESDTSWGTSTEVTITVSDDESGLSTSNSYEYFTSTEEEPTSEGSLSTYSSGGATISIEGTGKLYLFVKQISDVAGNTSSEGTTVTIGSTVYQRYGLYWVDNTAPTVEVESYTTNSVTFTGIDEESGIIAYAVTTSSTAPESDWEPVTLEPNLSETTIGSLTQSMTYYVWIKDSAGNIGYNTFTTATVDEVEIEQSESLIGKYVAYIPDERYIFDSNRK